MKNKGFTILELILYFSLFLIISLFIFDFTTRAYFNLNKSLFNSKESMEDEGTKLYFKKEINFDNMIKEPVITNDSISFETYGVDGDIPYEKYHKIYYDSRDNKIKYERKNLSDKSGINTIESGVTDFYIENEEDKIIINYTKKYYTDEEKIKVEIYK